MSKKHLFLIIAGIVIWVLWNDDKLSNRTPPADTTQSADQPIAASNKATETDPKDVWPYLQQSDSTQISDDLLRANIYVVLDGSGSMENTGCSGGAQKIDAAKGALIGFGKSVPANANLGILAFDSRGIFERAPLTRGNRISFDGAVSTVIAGGSTPLASAIRGAYQQLTKQAQAQLGYGTYHLVVVTDGEANKDEDPRSIVSGILNDSPIIVHTIGFCIKTNHSLNQPGKVLYHTANDYAGLKSGLDSVLAESDHFVVTDFQ